MHPHRLLLFSLTDKISGYLIMWTVLGQDHYFRLRSIFCTVTISGDRISDNVLKFAQGRGYL